MKRYAIFDIPSYYPCGGMADYVTSYNTLEEAQLYIARTMYSDSMVIEDMEDYDERDMLPIPTIEEFGEAVNIANGKRAKAMEDPMYAAVVKLGQDLERQLYHEPSMWERIKK